MAIRENFNLIFWLNLAIHNANKREAADPERVVDEIEDVIGVEAQDAVHASAKSGVGIEDILSSAPSQADSERETS
jgi:translation elongation factor EF-4